MSGCSSGQAGSTGQAGESSSLAGESTALLRSVNANSCSADSVCEMTSGSITGNLTAKGNVFLGKNTQGSLLAELKNASAGNPSSFNLYEQGVNFGIKLLPPTLAGFSGSVKISSDKGLDVSAYNIDFNSIKPITFASPFTNNSFFISNQPAFSNQPASATRTELLSTAGVLQIENIHRIEIGSDSVNFSPILNLPPGESVPSLSISYPSDGVTLTTSDNLYVKSGAYTGGQFILSGETAPDSVAGLVLISPDGYKWKLVVDNNGSLKTVKVQ